MKAGSTAPDLLGHLARRAAAVAPAVRPRLPSRFEPAALAAAAFNEATPAPRGDAAAAPAIAPSWHRAAVAGVDAAPRGSSLPLRAAAGETLAARASAGDAHPPATASSPAPGAQLRPGADLQVPGWHPPAQATPAHAADPVPAARAPLSATPARETALARPAGDAPSAIPPRQAPAALQLRVQSLSPLTPAAAPPAPPPTATAALAPRGAGSAPAVPAAARSGLASRAPTPPAIEITIGRIEVRAAAEPVAAPAAGRQASPNAARGAATAPPLSLADYLRRREGTR